MAFVDKNDIQIQLDLNAENFESTLHRMGVQYASFVQSINTNSKLFNNLLTNIRFGDLSKVLGGTASGLKKEFKNAFDEMSKDSNVAASILKRNFFALGREQNLTVGQMNSAWQKYFWKYELLVRATKPPVADAHVQAFRKAQAEAKRYTEELKKKRIEEENAQRAVKMGLLDTLAHSLPFGLGRTTAFLTENLARVGNTGGSGGLSGIVGVVQNLGSAIMSLPVGVIAGAVASVFLLKTAFELVSKVVRDIFIPAFVEGLKFNDLIENTRLGLAGLVMQMGTLTKGTSPFENWQQGLQISDKLVKELQDAALRMRATFSELARGLQEGLGPMLQAGLGEADITPFTERFVHSMNALRIPLREMGQEIRAFFNLETNPRTARLSFFLIGQAAKEMGVSVEEAKKRLQAMKDAGTLDEWFMKSTKGMELAGRASMNTLGGLISNVRELKERFLGLATADSYKALNYWLQETANDFLRVDEAGNVMINPAWITFFKDLGTVLGFTTHLVAGFISGVSGLVTGLTELYAWTKETFSLKIAIETLITGPGKWILEKLGLLTTDKNAFQPGFMQTLKEAGPGAFLGEGNSARWHGLSEKDYAQQGLLQEWNNPYSELTTLTQKRNFFGTLGLNQSSTTDPYTVEYNKEFAESFRGTSAKIEDSQNKLRGILSNNSHWASWKNNLASAENEYQKQLNEINADTKNFSDTEKEQLRNQAKNQLDLAQRIANAEYYKEITRQQEEFTESSKKLFDSLAISNLKLQGTPEHLVQYQEAIQSAAEAYRQGLNSLEKESPFLNASMIQNRKNLLEETYQVALKLANVAKAKGIAQKLLEERRAAVEVAESLTKNVIEKKIPVFRHGQLISEELAKEWDKRDEKNATAEIEAKIEASEKAAKVFIKILEDGMEKSARTFGDLFAGFAEDGFKGLAKSAARIFSNNVGDSAEKLADAFAGMLMGGKLGYGENGYTWNGADIVGAPEDIQGFVNQKQNQQRTINSLLQLGTIGVGSYAKGRTGEKGSITAGVIGGGMTGATMGAGYFSWAGAIIGAIVGGLAAAAGKAAAREEYKFAAPRFDAKGNIDFFQTKNINDAEREEMMTRAQDQFDTFWNGYMSLAVKYGAKILPKLSSMVGTVWIQPEASANMLKHWDEWINGVMPDQVAGMFKEGLSSVAQSMGMTAERFDAIWTKFDKLDPKKALELIGIVFDTLEKFNKLSDYLSSGSPTLGIGRFNQQVTNAQDLQLRTDYATIFMQGRQGIIDLANSISQLTGEAQVRGAQELANTMTQMMEDLKALAEEIAQFNTDSFRSFTAQRRQWQMDRMGSIEKDDQGNSVWKPDLQAQADFQKDYLQTVMDNIAKATNLDELRYWQGEYFNTMSSIGNLYQQMGPESYQAFLDWASGEDGMGGVSKLFQDTIAATTARWGEEIDTAMDGLIAQIQPVIDEFKGNFQDTGAAAQTLTTDFTNLSNAVRAATSALNGNGGGSGSTQNVNVNNTNITVNGNADDALFERRVLARRIMSKAS